MTIHPAAPSRPAHPGLLYDVRVCTKCDAQHIYITEGKVCRDGHLWFNCSCHSTHFVKKGGHSL